MTLMRIIVSARFDWSPHTSRFTVRMPTSTHDIFTELVAQEIGFQLKSVSHGNTDVAVVFVLVRSKFISDVYLYGHEVIDERYSKQSSDAFFAHAKSQYPSVVIETLYSQRQKDLTRLVDEYVFGSDENIAMVFGLDIEYGIGSKKASLSIWRSRLMPDPEKEKGVLLKTFSVREADVMASLLAHYQSISALVQR